MSPGSDRLRAVAEALEELRRLDLDPATPGGAVALEHLLRGPSVPAPAPPSAPVLHPDHGAGTGASPPLADNASPAARLAEWAAVDVDRIEDVIEFANDEPLLRIPAGRLPRGKADRQRTLVLIKLAVERIAYDRSDVPASRVNATCTDYACMDQNLPNNISSRGDLATRRGKRGSYFYRATQPGVQRARELLRTLFETEEELRVER